ncbi:MAG: hypothetical protein GF350_03005, partial [Chitinivibrionales bacterium]|nr:hypothetical protein [Chitinivibrionales bacterium]
MDYKCRFRFHSVFVGGSMLMSIFCGSVAAQEVHPRLFATGSRLDQIKTAISVSGSSQKQAFDLLKAKVDQNDINEFGATAGNWNYARSYLATSQALIHLLTGEQSYA